MRALSAPCANTKGATMRFFSRWLTSPSVNIDGETVTIRQIEQGLRAIGYSRRAALGFVRDLKSAIRQHTEVLSDRPEV